MTTGRVQGWSRHVVFLVDYPEFGTVFEVVQFEVGFAEGISAVVPFAPEVSVAFEVCWMNGKLLQLDHLSLTAHMPRDKRTSENPPNNLTNNCHWVLLSHVMAKYWKMLHNCSNFHLVCSTTF